MRHAASMELARTLVHTAGRKRKRRKHEITVERYPGSDIYYFRATIHTPSGPKRIRRSTEHTKLQAALRQAKIIRDEEMAGKGRETMVRPGYATVADVGRVWLEMAEIKTKRNNFSALKKFVRSFAAGDETKAAVSPAWAGQFEKYLRHWPGSHEGRKSTARQIRAMFGKRALRWYRHAGLILPDMTEFLEVMAENVKGESREKFKGIEPAVLARLEEAVERLRVSEDVQERKLWAVFALMRWCGLRNVEVEALRWSWIRRGRLGWEVRVIEYVYEDGSVFKPKKTPGVVPIGTGLLKRLLKALPRESVFVIPRANPTEAKVLCSRGINEFMRPFFPEAKVKDKKAYLLRKQAGSEVAARDGLLAMANFLRQQGIKTAWDNYYANLQPLRPL